MDGGALSGGERTGGAGAAIEPPVPDRTGETRVDGGVSSG